MRPRPGVSFNETRGIISGLPRARLGGIIPLFLCSRHKHRGRSNVYATNRCRASSPIRFSRLSRYVTHWAYEQDIPFRRNHCSLVSRRFISLFTYGHVPPKKHSKSMRSVIGAKINTDAEWYIVCRADRFDEHGGNEELWRAADELHGPRYSAEFLPRIRQLLRKCILLTASRARTHTRTRTLRLLVYKLQGGIQRIHD